MVHNEYIKCEVCGTITRVRLQIGFLDEHPIAVSCGKCGISLKGKVRINQEVVGVSCTFENAQTIFPSCTLVADYKKLLYVADNESDSDKRDTKRYNLNRSIWRVWGERNDL